MKFSIIIPVYNVEKYLDKCLNSVKNQTYKNYEVIIINDGSTDSSQNIIDKYVKENPNQFFSYIQENQGPGETRNRGVQIAKGDYIFFMDSDDYIDNNLLEILNNHVEQNKADLCRISNKVINENGNILENNIVKEFFNKSGEEAFIAIRKTRLIIENPPGYFIKKQYWVDNKFKFPKKVLHEDWGLIPLVLIKANSVSAIDGGAYYYHLVRPGSIVESRDYKSEVRKAFDTLKQYDFLVEEVNKIDIKNKKAKKMYLSYVTDGVIGKLKKLHGNEYEQYLKELKKKDVLKNAKVYSIKSFIKRILYIIFLKK